MSAYHSYDGIPSVADKHALTDILREEWGYEYYVSALAASGTGGSMADQLPLNRSLVMLAAQIVYVKTSRCVHRTQLIQTPLSNMYVRLL